MESGGIALPSVGTESDSPENKLAFSDHILATEAKPSDLPPLCLSPYAREAV